MSQENYSKPAIPKQIIDLAISGNFKKNHIRLIWLLTLHQKEKIALPLEVTLEREKICYLLNIRNPELGQILKDLYSMQLIEPKKESLTKLCSKNPKKTIRELMRGGDS